MGIIEKTVAKVEQDGWLSGILSTRSLALDHGHSGMVPEAIVLHYTGGGSAKGSVDWLTRQDDTYVSAHLVIDRDGSVTQLLPFTVEAWHAGKSEWQGKPNLNKWSIGIELVNFGYLDAKSANLAIVVQKEGKLWEAFPAEQVLTCLDICVAIRERYPFCTEILGHSDVSPGRKIDPGPAFPMTTFRNIVNNTERKLCV